MKKSLVKPRIKTLLVADLFCGAGGSSEGARRFLESSGFRMKLVAINHNPVAVDTHSRNHPTARHYCVDVDSTRPSQVVPEGYLDLLMASPSCVFFSKARGGKPVSDQQRMAPWRVVDWCTELRVKCLLVENVPEFMNWGPCGKNGKPLKKRKGEFFLAWVEALRRIGFSCEWKVLNAADYGDATTRERFFLMARSDGQKIVWPEQTHWENGVGEQRWRAAREVIDWNIQGASIFDRKKPLSKKTLCRILAGAIRFQWPQGFIRALRKLIGPGHKLIMPKKVRARPGDPVLLRSDMHKSNASCFRSPDEPLPTLTTRSGLGVAEPFLMPQRSDKNPSRTVSDPVPTVTTVPRMGVAEPMLSPYYGQSGCASVKKPLATVTTKARFGLVVPVTHAGGHKRGRTVDVPLPTITGAHRGELAVAEPSFVCGNRTGNAPKSVNSPLPTTTTAPGGGVFMAQPEPFFTDAFGERRDQTPRTRDIKKPVPTICAKGRINLAMARPVRTSRRKYDILFRMLEPSELARAMGFSNEDIEYEFTGTKTDITKQIGNAVPVSTASALVGAFFRVKKGGAARRRRKAS